MNSKDVVEVTPTTRKIGTKTTVAKVDMDAASKDLEAQKVKGDTSTPPSPDTPTLSMDAIGTGDNAAGGEGTTAKESLSTQQEMKTKSEALPKAAVAKSKKGAGDQKAKQSTLGMDNSDPYSVGGAVEGLKEASAAQGDGMIVVCGLTYTKAACPSTALSAKKRKKPPPSPMKVNSQGEQI
jgi:hypothetical protein